MPDQVIILPDGTTVDQSPLKAVIFTREQVTQLLAFIRAVADQNVRATPTKWDDFVFGLVDAVAFGPGAVDQICKWLGIP